MIASIIIALYLFGTISAGEAATFLFIYGALLLVAEIGIASLGTLALTGALALYFGYVLQTGDNLIFGVPIGWPLLFGVAFVELGVIAIVTIFFLRYRRVKTTTGTESMIGQKAVVIDWKGKSGRVLIQGEPWKAVSDTALDLQKDMEVSVSTIEGLKVRISP